MILNYRFFVLYALLLGASAFVYLHEDLAVPVNRPLAEIPQQVGPWKMVSEARFDQQILEVLKPTDYLSRVYRDEQGNRASLYLGYHGGGPDSGPIHSPKHCLPGSGWHNLSTRPVRIQVDGKDLNLVQAVYQRGSAYELFIYWFQVKEKTLSGEYALKFAEVLNSIFYNRRDSAFIRVSVPFEGDKEEALKAGEAFIRDLYPHINSVLPG